MAQVYAFLRTAFWYAGRLPLHPLRQLRPEHGLVHTAVYNTLMVTSTRYGFPTRIGARTGFGSSTTIKTLPARSSQWEASHVHKQRPLLGLQRPRALSQLSLISSQTLTISWHV